MKLLLDENLPQRIVAALEPEFPGSSHVRQVGLDRADDAAIWTFAAQNGFAIVSKDSDFRQRSFLYGAPPKVIWLRLGNCATAQILATILSHVEQIRRFNEDNAASFFTLE